jgi:D-beta-D-heptose 7-phosphate kinase/D-beta-D-heptose 1-phosphate adenosyltransferase
MNGDGGTELALQVGKLAEARVAVVGDVMLDRYVYGEVDRISPEAPVPVCRVVDEAAMLGGAGNVVRNLAALGARVRFVAAVGVDPAAAEVEALLGALDGVRSDLVAVPGRVTTIKTRFFAGIQQLLRADQENTAPPAAAVVDDLVARATDALGWCDVLVLSDYGKGVLSEAVAGKLIAAARAAGRPVVVDPKGNDFTRYTGATLVTPNRRELADASHMGTKGDAAVVAAAERVMQRCGIAGMLVTRSAEGMTLVTGDGVSHLPADARAVFDVSGAGDTVVAVVAAAIGAGLAPVDAARLANIAAGIVVGKVGTAVAYGEEIIAAIGTNDSRVGAGTKVLAKAPALDRIRGWRAQGFRIGFTNGCFDLIHPGHVALLAKARAACDRLVVGLNSDDSVRRLKGPTRPVQNEASRAAVLASLGSVDLVVVFGEDTPVRLIEAIRPDILAKGADYSVAQVVGGAFVQGYGGKVMLVDLEEGHSTSATIARLTR